MVNKVKQKKRLRKAVMRRQRQLAKEALEKAWRQIWINNGILKG